MFVPTFISVSKITEFYNLNYVINKGGNGVVYSATEVKSSGKISKDGESTEVAVKAFAKDSEGINFREVSNESSIMEALRNSAYTLSLTLLLEDTIGYYICMERAQHDLFDVVNLHDSALAPPPSKVMLDVYSGLEYMHHKHIIHRDLKS